jgi:hypothetical protein
VLDGHCADAFNGGSSSVPGAARVVPTCCRVGARRRRRRLSRAEPCPSISVPLVWPAAGGTPPVCCFHVIRTVQLQRPITHELALGVRCAVCPLSAAPARLHPSRARSRESAARRNTRKRLHPSRARSRESESGSDTYCRCFCICQENKKIL